MVCEIDNEIRELGEKYSIPTEFTSYLVVEPGMQVVTGVATGTARRRVEAAAAPATVSQAQFDAARDAAKQRSATNLAVADEADLSASAQSTHRVGARTFTLNGETWIDMRRSDSATVLKVKAFSDAYFKLMDVIPELRDIFALGDKVKVNGRSVSIEVGTAGIESISASELERIRSGW